MRLPPLSGGGGGDQVVVGTDSIAGTAVFSNSNNVSFGVSSGTVTATATIGHTGPVALQGSGTAVVTNGTVQFANSNGVTFGLNASTFTASVSPAGPAAISAGAASVGAGTVVFSNSNGVSFGLNGSTVTASASAAAGGANMSFWIPYIPGGNAVNFTTVSRPFFFPINLLAPMQGNMTWDTMGIAMTGATQTSVSTVNAHTISVLLGIYKLNNATQISLINSVSWTTGLAASASSWQEIYAGTRFFTLGTGAWSSLPSVVANSSYWGGIIVSTAGTLANAMAIVGNIAFAGQTFSGLVGSAFTTKPATPFLGAYSAASAALPTVVSYGEVFALTASGGAGVIPDMWAAQGLSWL